MKTLPQLDLVRAVSLTPELRADGDGPSDILGTLYGHFSVFDEWYRISSWWEGDFLERVGAGSFRKTMAERRSKIVTAFDHGFDFSIGDKVLGPIDDLREDDVGAYYEVGLMDTSYNRDLLPGLKRNLYGASFRFQMIKEEWNEEPGKSDHNPDGLPERTIKEVRLFEFGPVTYPASPAATAGMRSIVGMTDTYYERLRSRDPHRVDEMRAALTRYRTAQGIPAAPALEAPVVAAPEPTDEPTKRHSGGLAHAARREALYPYLKENS